MDMPILAISRFRIENRYKTHAFPLPALLSINFSTYFFEIDEYVSLSSLSLCSREVGC